MNYYFAYGSNLNAKDLFERADIELNPVGLALLPGYRLIFNYRSRSRRGGAISVTDVDATQHAVAGVLFEVPDGGLLAAIDRKEGHPNSYQRVPVSVWANGARVEAFTYITNPNREETFVQPTDAYVSVVAQGYRDHGLDIAPLHAAAAGSARASQVDGVFVYGTLLAGEERAHLVNAAGPRVDATTRGRLIDLGDYPGLVDGVGTVQGEYVPLADLESTLAELDRYEGFYGYAANAGSLYHRIMAFVSTPAGTRLAWTYRYVPDGAGWPEIPGGSWRNRPR